MPGNKKTKRKNGPRRRIEIKAPPVAQVFAQGLVDDYARLDALVKMKNTLPLGHDLNRHKIDEVMLPLETFVRDMETTGEAPVDEHDRLIFWCENDADWIPLGDGILSMYMMLDLVAPHFGWGPIPTGLRDLVVKMESDQAVDQHDTAAAHTAMDWIRIHVAEVTPSQWGAAYEQACAIVDAREAQPGADGAAGEMRAV